MRRKRIQAEAIGPRVEFQDTDLVLVAQFQEVFTYPISTQQAYLH